ncbi:TlpA family protein disulfide reductase [Mucilaginibacter sp. 22184]|uniref:TlpA family protein disulfide reductase n=1 Tax=Mucilaginibacter sp. 22184 TaxID=3453887 RepID=UPI003F84F5FD
MRRFLGFLGLLCLFLRVAAQENKYMGDGGVLVGQVVQDVLVRGVRDLRLDGRLVSGELRFSALRGRLVILDFWAGWCAPCRKMLPVMDSLQRVLGDVVLFLPVAYEPAVALDPVLASMRRVRPFALPGVFGDVVLNGLFPHRSLPHLVWVDASGVVRAVTEEGELTGEKVRAALAGNWRVLVGKRELVRGYDKEKGLLEEGNGGDASALVYRSVLSAYLPGVSGGLDRGLRDSSGALRLLARNVPLPLLCTMAFSDGGRWFAGPTVRVLSADSGRLVSRLSGQAYERWLGQGNGWCYELRVPPVLADSAFALMRGDIARLFPAYRVGVERLRTRCLALVRTSALDKLRSAGGAFRAEVGPYAAELRNSPLAFLMKRLQVQYMQDSPVPVVDETGYSGRVDLSLEAPLGKVDLLNKALEKYDLRFEERVVPVDLLVIRDAGAVGVSRQSARP